MWPRINLRQRFDPSKYALISQTRRHASNEWLILGIPKIESILQIASIGSQSNAGNHFRELRQHNRRSKRVGFEDLGFGEFQKSTRIMPSSPPVIICVESSLKQHDVTWKSWAIVLTASRSRASHNWMLKWKNWETLQVPSSEQLIKRWSSCLEPSTPFTNDVWPLSLRFSCPYYLEEEIRDLQQHPRHIPSYLRQQNTIRFHRNSKRLPARHSCVLAKERNFDILHIHPTKIYSCPFQLLPDAVHRGKSVP